MEDFAKRKFRILKGLAFEGAPDRSGCNPNETEFLNNSAANLKPDKSLKGDIDALLVPICDLLNSHPDYVTTSCCSGRITAYQQASTDTGKRVKSGCRLVFVSHEPVDPSEGDKLLTEILKGARHYPEKKSIKETEREETLSSLSHTDLKLEPLLLHVEAATESSSLALLKAAVAAGLRDSGISALGKRNIVAIRGSQRMEVPLTLGLSSDPPHGRETLSAAAREGEMVLVTPSYFSSLLLLCNQKLKWNEQQINRLLQILKKQLFPDGRPEQDTQKFQEPGSSCQPAGYGNCTDTCASSGGAAAKSEAAVFFNTVSPACGCHTSSPKSSLEIKNFKEMFVGVREKQKLKVVKSALEALGLFDKTRKVQQIELSKSHGVTSKVTPQPPPGCTWLGMLPVTGPVSTASLPQDVQGFLVLNSETAEFLQCFSLASSAGPRALKRSVARCLDTLLRAACESVPGGQVLLQQAKQLQRGEAPQRASAAAAADAADEPVVTWPEKFERMGDVLLFPSGSLDGFQKLKQLGCETVGAAQMDLIEQQMWREFCRKFFLKAVGLQAPIAGRMRQSRVHLVFGKTGLTSVREHGVLYTLDVTKCMYASGNGTERVRFRKSLLQGAGPPETVVDLFCGIGYFSLPALSFVPPERLAKVYACDISPTAIQFFNASLQQNGVDPRRVTFLLCDSFSCPCEEPAAAAAASPAAVAAAVDASLAAAAARDAICSSREQMETDRAPPVPAALLGAADRISIGLIPSSQQAWSTAVSLLNNKRGGILHVHGVAPLEAVEEGEEPVSSTVYVHPSSGRETAAAAAAAETDASDRDRNPVVGGNCKLGIRLRFAQQVLKEIAALVREKKTKQGDTWQVSVHHVETVKSYAPRRYHFVVDVSARPVQNPQGETSSTSQPLQCRP